MAEQKPTHLISEDPRRQNRVLGWLCDFLSGLVWLLFAKIKGLASKDYAAAERDLSEAAERTTETEFKQRLFESSLRKEQAEAASAELKVLDAKLELIKKAKGLGLCISHSGVFEVDALSQSGCGTHLDQFLDKVLYPPGDQDSDKERRKSLGTIIERLAGTVDKLAHAVSKSAPDIDNRIDKLDEGLQESELGRQLLTLEKRIERLEAQVTDRNHS